MGSTKITATPDEINQALDGISVDVTAANLSEVTGGAETDLHSHASSGSSAGLDAVWATVELAAAEDEYLLNANATVRWSAGITADPLNDAKVVFAEAGVYACTMTVRITDNTNADPPAATIAASDMVGVTEITVPPGESGLVVTSPTRTMTVTAGQSAFLPDLQNNGGAAITVAVNLFLLKIA